MEPRLRVVGLVLGVGLVALVALHRYVFLPASLSLFRQDLFYIRRRLFLIGAEGAIPFNHPAYTHIRFTINGLLRFAERATLSRIAFTLWIADPFFSRTREAVYVHPMASIQDEELRKRLHWVRVRLGIAMLAHLLRTSPIMWFFGVLFLIVYAFQLVRLAMGRGNPTRDLKEKVGEKMEPVAQALIGDCHPA